MTHRITLNRRQVVGLGLGAASLAAGTAPRAAMAQSAPPVAASTSTQAAPAFGAPTHGMSAFGDLKYPADFPHFDDVNAEAPKGGVFSTYATGSNYHQQSDTFNSLQGYIARGAAATGMDQTFAALMVRSPDEPDAMYGLAASAVSISDDGLIYRFSLRPEARFHDGSRLTAHDAAFSLNTLKTKGHPIISQQLRDMLAAEALDDATLAVTFRKGRGRDVPLFAAGLPIFSKAYYATRAFDESSLDIPLGSGPYKVGRFEAGRYIEFERVTDWWAAALPAARGFFNFDTVRFEYFRDREAGFAGFSARVYLYREEFTSLVWETRYNFPAVRDGRVRLETLPDQTPSAAQGWFLNLRRDKFKDPRVREALGLIFDFEWTNKNIFYSAYKRTASPFQNSDLMASGLPSPEEVALLEPFRGQVPDEVFGQPFVPPVSDGSGRDRALWRRAQQLLDEAGCRSVGGRRQLPGGEPFAIEFLDQEPVTQRFTLPFVKSLETLGITASLRIMESAQLQVRRNDFDYDVIAMRYAMPSTPGDALRSFFSSQSAAIKGSQNLAGIANPALDALIGKIIAADTRDDLRTACRAFDRVFRAGRYWIPMWYLAGHRLAFWDVFGRPQTMPRFAGAGAPDLWWAAAGRAAHNDKAAKP